MVYWAFILKIKKRPRTDDRTDERTDGRTNGRTEWHCHYLSCSSQLKKWHHLVVQPVGTTWRHMATPWCYSGATLQHVVQPSVQRWHHCSTTWCQGGATGRYVVPLGATGGGTTLHHQVVPLFSMPADHTTEYRHGGPTSNRYGLWHSCQ